MTAGRGHPRPNLRHGRELAKLLAEGDAPQLMRRWAKLDVEHDIPDLAGYNVIGTTRYIDRDVFQAILDPDHAKATLGAPIDTGLTPEETIAAILEHEGIEKVLLDADNDIDSYLDAHEFATAGEHDKVRADGSTPKRYEGGLRQAIAYCAKKQLAQVPAELACAPVLDDPDKNDKRILKELRRLGVIDAFKRAKGTVGYARSSGADQCRGCAHWQADRNAPMSACDQVDGLVRADRWCKLYEQLGGGSHEDKAQGNAAAEGAPPGQNAPNQTGVQRARD